MAPEKRLFHDECQEKYFCIKCAYNKNAKCLICEKLLYNISHFNVKRHFKVHKQQYGSQELSDYSEIKAIHILNSELADSLGNILNRCSGAAVNPDQIFPQYCQASFEMYCKTEEGLKLVDLVSTLPDLAKEHFQACNFYKGIDAVIATLHAANGFFESHKPWELRKKQLLPQLNAVLHLTMETLRVCGIVLQPIVPRLSGALLDKLAISQEQRMWKDIRPFSWEEDTSKDIPISAEKITLYKRIMIPNN